MSIDNVSCINESFTAAVLKDSQWKAVIPITSTHFKTCNHSATVIPNNTGRQNELNMLDMLNHDLITKDNVIRQMGNHRYPCTRGGSRAILQLEEFNGDSDKVIDLVQKSIKDRARLHSTILTSNKESRIKRK